MRDIANVVTSLRGPRVRIPPSPPPSPLAGTNRDRGHQNPCGIGSCGAFTVLANHLQVPILASGLSAIGPRSISSLPRSIWTCNQALTQTERNTAMATQDPEGDPAHSHCEPRSNLWRREDRSALFAKNGREHSKIIAAQRRGLTSVACSRKQYAAAHTFKLAQSKRPVLS